MNFGPPRRLNYEDPGLDAASQSSEKSPRVVRELVLADKRRRPRAEDSGEVAFLLADVFASSDAIQALSQGEGTTNPKALP